MRLPDDRPYVRKPRRAAPLLTATALAALLAGCGALGGGGGSPSVAAALPANGPQADYPMVLGDAYTIDGVTHRPADTLNYDEVGYLAAPDAGAMGITAAHHSLPVPSYVEVTSLDSGRTILARIERRGPMRSNDLLALSPAALAQLGAGEGVAVRVRRVNPPEEQRALLRSGDSAPLRMDTPMSLVSVLRRKLTPSATPTPAVASAPIESVDPNAGAPAVAIPQPAPAPVATPAPANPLALPPLAGGPAPAVVAAPAPAPAPVAVATPAAAPVATPAPRPSATNGLMVQAAAFSTEERARRVAAELGGSFSQSGNLWRVRTGPFATRAEAEASLAFVRRAGYSDARILTGG